MVKSCLWCGATDKFPFCTEGGTHRGVNHIDSREKTVSSFCLNDYLAYRKVRLSLGIQLDSPVDEYYRLYKKEVMLWYRALTPPHTFARPDAPRVVKEIPVSEIVTDFDALDDSVAVDFMRGDD